jgi:type IV secretion system protein TrbJ
MPDREQHQALFPGQVGPDLPAMLLAFSPKGGCMKLRMNKRNKYLLTGGLLLLTATPSFALFGIGDIVFDPTSYASLVSQLTTLESQYKMLQNNITHFSLKQQWQTTLNAMKNANVANMFGETSGMSIALNTNSPSASSTAWTAGTIKVSGNTTSYLQGQTPGSAQLSQLAMIEASDSISPDCLTAVGQYRGARTQNVTANNTLASQQLDGSDGTNTEVEQLNILNAAEAQKMSEMQSQGVLQACLASQMTVTNMQQRNAAAQDLNTAAFVQQQRSTNNVSAANESNTWQTYLP